MVNFIGFFRYFDLMDKISSHNFQMNARNSERTLSTGLSTSNM